MGIVTYKTAFYSFYLPVACGLVLAGRADEANLKLARRICLQMGQYFQVSTLLQACRFSLEIELLIISLDKPLSSLPS